MDRVEGWRTHLTAHIKEQRDRPFEFGYHDCAMWVAGCVYKITGVDHASHVRGTYSTPEGAYKAIRKGYDVDSLIALYDAKFKRVHIAFARPGDIVFKMSNFMGFDCIAGICYGLHSFFVSEDLNTLVEIPTLDCDGGWHVG